MATQFFIGGNKFYADEQEAEHDLKTLRVRYGVPEEFFTIVKIHKEEPGGTFEPRTSRILH